MSERVRRSWSRAAAAVATTAAVALVVAGCSGDSGVAQFDARPTLPSPHERATHERAGTSAADPTRFHRYVALGDSYTAAPFVPLTQLSNGCLRSSDNYPALVAAGMPGTRLVDVSCSGADTASMTGIQRIEGADQPPQFDALTRGTDLVTVGIGGNDFHL